MHLNIFPVVPLVLEGSASILSESFQTPFLLLPLMGPYVISEIASIFLFIHCRAMSDNGANPSRDSSRQVCV